MGGRESTVDGRLASGVQEVSPHSQADSMRSSRLSTGHDQWHRPPASTPAGGVGSELVLTRSSASCRPAGRAAMWGVRGQRDDPSVTEPPSCQCWPSSRVALPVDSFGVGWCFSASTGHGHGPREQAPRVCPWVGMSWCATTRAASYRPGGLPQIDKLTSRHPPSP